LREALEKCVTRCLGSGDCMLGPKERFLKRADNS
jgi:hypothetical protein